MVGKGQVRVEGGNPQLLERHPSCWEPGPKPICMPTPSTGSACSGVAKGFSRTRVSPQVRALQVAGPDALLVSSTMPSERDYRRLSSALRVTSVYYNGKKFELQSFGEKRTHLPASAGPGLCLQWCSA